jgi:hypothetical protein
VAFIVDCLHGLHSSLWRHMGCVGLCLLDKQVFVPFLHFSFSGCVHQCSCLGFMSNPSHVLCALFFMLVLIIVTILTVVLILVVLFLPFFSYQCSSPLSSLFHLVLILIVFSPPFFLVSTHCRSHHHPHHGLVMLALFFLLVLITIAIGINDFILKNLIH